MWARLISVALGGWLIVAPTVLGYPGVVAAANARATGPIVVGASLVAVWQVMRPLRWVELAAGGGLLVAPWILFKWYGTLPTINSLGVGLVLVVLAFLGGKTGERFGGGWRMLLREERPEHPGPANEST